MVVLLVVRGKTCTDHLYGFVAWQEHGEVGERMQSLSQTSLFHKFLEFG